MHQIIDKRAVLDCIGLDLVGDGHLMVRFALASFTVSGEHLDEGHRNAPAPDGTLTKQKNVHRFVLHPGDDVDALIAGITPHLAVMGYDPPSAADVQFIKAVAMARWTPEAVARHTQRWIEWERVNEANCRALGIPAMTMEQGRTLDFVERLGVSLREWETQVREPRNRRMLQ